MKTDLSPYMIYSSVGEVTRQTFLGELSGDGLCIEEELTLDISFTNFLSKLKIIAINADPGSEIAYLRGNNHEHYQMVTYSGSAIRLLVQVRWHSDGDINTPEKAVFGVTITGNPKCAQNFLSILRETFPERLSRIRWWFMSGTDLTYHDVVLRKPSLIKPEYYPFMQDPTEYMRGYLNHRASLLFLSGPAGTGKTTLLRNFLYQNQLRAVVTYEDVLFNSDRMFVDFVTSSNHDVMIIEDADIMLGSREHSGNKMIARFLNASDGIIQLEDKKIIFTTNLGNFNDVDEALVRPGRSYGAVMFRALTPCEAMIAANAAGVQNWKTPDHDITLAEVFNPPNTSFGKRTLGFTAA